MFLFIEHQRLPPYWQELDLNTSHVLIYREQPYELPHYCQFKYISCSYLSLLVLPERFLLLPFKYISCSYLSRRWLNSPKAVSYLNTSHVLIYHRDGRKAAAKGKFKYISCSYLSCAHGCQRCSSCQFKYISCSYLSNVFTHFLFSIISYIALFFNISQLFYQPPPHFSFSSSLVSFPLIL